MQEEEGAARVFEIIKELYSLGPTYAHVRGKKKRLKYTCCLIELCELRTRLAPFALAHEGPAAAALRAIKVC